MTYFLYSPDLDSHSSFEFLSIHQLPVLFPCSYPTMAFDLCLLAPHLLLNSKLISQFLLHPLSSQIHLVPVSTADGISFSSLLYHFLPFTLCFAVSLFVSSGASTKLLVPVFMPLCFPCPFYFRPILLLLLPFLRLCWGKKMCS